MYRWSVVLLLSTAGCGARPCEDDDCRIQRVEAATDPEVAFALADEVVDPARRDLVWMDLIRQTGWDRCDALSDAALQARCATTLQRPHLLSGRYEAVAKDCAAATGEAEDTCRLDAADARLRGGDLGGAAARRRRVRRSARESTTARSRQSERDVASKTPVHGSLRAGRTRGSGSMSNSTSN